MMIGKGGARGSAGDADKAAGNWKARQNSANLVDSHRWFVLPDAHTCGIGGHRTLHSASEEEKENKEVSN